MDEEDQHTLNKYGNLDWENLAKVLAKAKQDISLDYEILNKLENNAEEVLSTVYNQACELENLILRVTVRQTDSHEGNQSNTDYKIQRRG